MLLTLAVACVGLSHAQTSPDAQAQTSTSQNAQPSQGQPSEAEKARYADALAYCRGNTPSAIALRNDKRVLCINGWIFTSFDFWPVYGLAQGGFVVVRIWGGEIATTIKLADLIRSKQATVVINGYCLADCASYLFVASLRTFVPKDSLVAWSIVNDANECVRFSETTDRSAPRLDIAPCTGVNGYGRPNEYLNQLKHKFYEGRVLAQFRDPPESLMVRRMLKHKFDGMGEYPSVYWTWNPRFYASVIRTKVFYEDYPQSQSELDDMVTQLKLPWSVIYDP